MKLKDADGWAKTVANNTKADDDDCDYGGGIVRYAERWADLMEAKIETGERLEDVADALSHDADTEGITGFMYGAAVSILAQVWEHGEQLRHWHNLKTQIHDEGEKANEAGATLNPALMTIIT